MTRLFAGVRTGDEDAARALFERYFPRLVLLARARLRSGPTRLIDDEQDVALSALGSFYAGAEDGRIAGLADRDHLWCLLAKITSRKVCDKLEKARARKRGGGMVRRELDDEFTSDEPDPEFAAAVSEEFESLIRGLGDETLQKVATWLLEGYTVKEIANRLNRTPQTVYNKIERIKILLGRLE